MSRRTTPGPDAGFRALSDPTRRDILKLLHKRQVCSAGEIAAQFPNISRPAVSRHLRVLREVGLINAEGVGREQRYRVSLGRLARVHHEWFRQLEDVWHSALATLRDRVESRAPRASSSARRRRA